MRKKEHSGQTALLLIWNGEPDQKEVLVLPDPDSDHVRLPAIDLEAGEVPQEGLSRFMRSVFCPKLQGFAKFLTGNNPRRKLQKLIPAVVETRSATDSVVLVKQEVNIHFRVVSLRDGRSNLPISWIKPTEEQIELLLVGETLCLEESRKRQVA